MHISCNFGKFLAKLILLAMFSTHNSLFPVHVEIVSSSICFLLNAYDMYLSSILQISFAKHTMWHALQRLHSQYVECSGMWAFPICINLCGPQPSMSFSAVLELVWVSSEHCASVQWLANLASMHLVRVGNAMCVFLCSLYLVGLVRESLCTILNICLI